jgi:hypothetical protein
MGDIIRTPAAALEELYQAALVRGEFPSLTSAFLKQAIDGVMGWTVTEEGRHLQARFDGLADLLHSIVDEPTRQRLIQTCVTQIPGNDLKILDGLFSTFIHSRYAEDLAALAREDKGKARVLFIARRPYFQILREALHLKQLGYTTILLSMTQLPQNLRALFQNTFGHVFRVPDHPCALPTMIQAIDADILHIQCWMLDYALSRFIIEHKGRAACVCEFYDITSIVGERDVLASHWPEETIDLDLASERFICRQADAIVCRFPPVVADELRERHGGLTRFAEMHPFACPELTSGREPRSPMPDGVPRLVYAGVLIPENGSCPAALYPEIHLRATFERLLQQGLALEVIMDPQRPMDPRNPPPGYEGFAALVERYPRYRFRSGCAPDELAKLLSGYDFGVVNLTTFDQDVLRLRPSIQRYAVGTKLFTYLEAELPVLVNAEYEYMAAIVEEHGLGIAIHTSELDQVANKIRAFDYARSVKCIQVFNQTHGMKQEIHELMALYDAVLGRPRSSAPKLQRPLAWEAQR